MPYTACTRKTDSIVPSLDEMKLKEAARYAHDGASETPTYTCFPMGHWRRIRANNAMESLNREIGHRTRVADTLPDGKSALMLVTDQEGI